MGRCIDLSKILSAVIDEKRNFVISPSEGFSGDSNAEIIEIDIGPFADEGFDFYILNYEVFSTNGMLNSNIIRTDTDEPAYISNGVIYCPLTSQLTASGKLRIQLEAHKKTDKGEVVKKSSIAELDFAESLMGESDLLGSSSSVIGRLEDIEDRLDTIDSENRGGRISTLEDKTDALEKNSAELKSSASSLESKTASLEEKTADLIERTAEAEGKIKTVESYNIPQTFSDIKERLTAIEEKPDALESIPVASKTTLGGIKVAQNSEFRVAENGLISLDYSALKNHSIVASVVLSLLYVPGNVEITVGNTSDEIAAYVSDCTSQVASGFMNAFAFVCFSNGSVEYTDENFNILPLPVEANAVYVFKLVDGALQHRSYIGNELRTLILEGI